MRSRRLVLVVLAIVTAALALNGALWLAQSSLAVGGEPWSLGAAVVRAEVVVKNATGLHDFRIDRGRLLNVRPQAVVLRERDGIRVVVPVAPGARVILDGAPTTIALLPRGSHVETVRDGDAPASRVTAVTAG
jgi:hypothetical protein